MIPGKYGNDYSKPSRLKITPAIHALAYSIQKGPENGCGDARCRVLRVNTVFTPASVTERAIEFRTDTKRVHLADSSDWC